MSCPKCAELEAQLAEAREENAEHMNDAVQDGQAVKRFMDLNTTLTESVAEYKKLYYDTRTRAELIRTSLTERVNQQTQLINKLKVQRNTTLAYLSGDVQKILLKYFEPVDELLKAEETHRKQKKMGNTFGSAIEQAARFQKALEEIRAIEDWRVDRAVKIAIEALSIQDSNKVEALPSGSASQEKVGGDGPAGEELSASRAATESRNGNPVSSPEPSPTSSKDCEHEWKHSNTTDTGFRCFKCGVDKEGRYWRTMRDGVPTQTDSSMDRASIAHMTEYERKGYQTSGLEAESFRAGAAWQDRETSEFRRKAAPTVEQDTLLKCRQCNSWRMSDAAAQALISSSSAPADYHPDLVQRNKAVEAALEAIDWDIREMRVRGVIDMPEMIRALKVISDALAVARPGDSKDG